MSHRTFDIALSQPWGLLSQRKQTALLWPHPLHLSQSTVVQALTGPPLFPRRQQTLTCRRGRKWWDQQVLGAEFVSLNTRGANGTVELIQSEGIFNSPLRLVMRTNVTQLLKEQRHERLELGTPAKVCWESLTQFPPASPCVLCTAAAIEGNLPQTSDTGKNEANDNFADCLFRREMETIVSVWIFMFLPSFMVLRHAANGNSGVVYSFSKTLVFFRSNRVEQSHERPSGDCTGTTGKVPIQFDHSSTAAWQGVGLLEEIRLQFFLVHLLHPEQTVYKEVN